MRNLRPPKTAALATCALVLVATPGCQFLQQLMGMASSLQGGGLPIPGFQGASLGGSNLGGVPNLGAAGVTSPSPSSGVSPPGSAATIQGIQQRYGFQVGGSAATAENLARLEKACQYYDAQKHLQGLQSVELIDKGGPLAGTAGLWSTNGMGASIKLYAFAEPGAAGNVINTHAAVHELGHHVCELTGQGAFTPQLDQNIQASPQPVPTRYAATQTSELRAETVATLLNGGVERPPGFLANYQPAPALVQQIRAEFPRTSL
jgi:hypothetical protein